MSYTGNEPKFTTQAPLDNSTKVATTAYVEAAVAAGGGGGATVIDSIADADTTNAPSRNAVFDALVLKAAASHTHALSDITQSAATTGQVPEWSGTAWVPVTPSGGGASVIDSIADADTTNAPSRNAVFDALALKAPLASPALTGTPTAPTASAADNSTKIATTAYVDTADALKANLASPTFTGTPAAPTAAGGTNTTQVATTAFVKAAVDAIPASASLAALDIDWSAARAFYKTVSANSTFTFSNVTDGKDITVFITNSGGSSITITLPTVTREPGILSINAGKTAAFSFTRANSITFMSAVTDMEVV